jgi:hypothetical protein
MDMDMLLESITEAINAGFYGCAEQDIYKLLHLVIEKQNEDEDD